MRNLGYRRTVGRMANITMLRCPPEDKTRHHASMSLSVSCSWLFVMAACLLLWRKHYFCCTEMTHCFSESAVLFLKICVNCVYVKQWQTTKPGLWQTFVVPRNLVLRQCSKVLKLLFCDDTLWKKSLGRIQGGSLANPPQRQRNCLKQFL